LPRGLLALLHRLEALVGFLHFSIGLLHFEVDAPQGLAAPQLGFLGLGAQPVGVRVLHEEIERHAERGCHTHA
jgi:hypothetical protein